MKHSDFVVRNALPEEFARIGQLMVDVYSGLDGFPSPDEQPRYYDMLANIGSQTEKPDTQLLAAISRTGELGGAIVYFSDMSQYGSGGTATLEQNASGFRLLAVDPAFRRRGIGRLLSEACIQKARKLGQDNVVIHTTRAMQPAWRMYESLGFERATDLDFMQEELPVFGFRLGL